MSRQFVLDEHPLGIINILDATNIERNLYLTSQCLEMEIPMVVALNMMDELTGNGWLGGHQPHGGDARCAGHPDLRRYG